MKTKSIFLCITMLVMTLMSQTQTAHAQKDSTVSITLPAQHHAFIVAFMPSKSDVDDIKYLNQVAGALQLNDSLQVIDTAQQITVTVNFDQVKKMYLAIGSAQERLAGYYNTEIKQLLIPQLFTHPTLLNDIIGIKDANGADTEYLITLGFEYLKAIK